MASGSYQGRGGYRVTTMVILATLEVLTMVKVLWMQIL